MVDLLPSPSSVPVLFRRVRAVRPALIDPRFVGDPWIVDHCDGTASVRLDDYPIATLALGVFDLPALNRLWTDLRWRLTKRHRAYPPKYERPINNPAPKAMASKMMTATAISVA
jgi:hypothetical protein